MPIVVGAPRSGTTLLRFMLDAHPELAVPPETGFLALGEGLADGRGATDLSDGVRREAFFATVTTFPPDAPAWPDFGIPRDQFREALAAIEPFSIASGCRAFYRLYASRFGKSRWGDKTPLYCLHLQTIARQLPEAHFIHVIRDGRDVALSLRETWFAPGRDLETLAAHWRECIETARAQRGNCAHYLEVRFEDLVAASRTTLERICAFIDLPFAVGMLDYHERTPERLAEHRDRLDQDGRLVISHENRLRQQALTMRPPQTSRVSAWRTHMSDEERRRFEHLAGDLLETLGYSE